MSPAKTKVRPDAPTAPDAALIADVRALAALGMSGSQGARMVANGQAGELSAAIETVLGPGPTTEIVFGAAGSRQPESSPDSAELVVAYGVLGRGALHDADCVVRALATALKPGGQLAAVIDTFATRAAVPDREADDAILFPDLAALGLLGPEAERRTALPPAAWLALLASAGLTVTATAGYEEQALSDETVRDHAVRLTAYDPQEIATGRLFVLAEKRGAAT